MREGDKRGRGRGREGERERERKRDREREREEERGVPSCCGSGKEASSLSVHHFV